jgi:hypothetical protein
LIVLPLLARRCRPEKTTKPFLLEAVDGYFKRTAGERDDGAGGGGDEMDEDEA